MEDEILAVSGRWDGTNDRVVEAYDPSTDEWSRIDAKPTPQSGTAGATIDGRFFLGGGEDPLLVGGWTTDRHEMYDELAGRGYHRFRSRFTDRRPSHTILTDGGLDRSLYCTPSNNGPADAKNRPTVKKSGENHPF